MKLVKNRRRNKYRAIYRRFLHRKSLLSYLEMLDSPFKLIKFNGQGYTNNDPLYRYFLFENKNFNLITPKPHKYLYFKKYLYYFLKRIECNLIYYKVKGLRVHTPARKYKILINRRRYKVRKFIFKRVRDNIFNGILRFRRRKPRLRIFIAARFRSLIKKRAKNVGSILILYHLSKFRHFLHTFVNFPILSSLRKRGRDGKKFKVDHPLFFKRVRLLETAFRIRAVLKKISKFIALIEPRWDVDQAGRTKETYKQKLVRLAKRAYRFQFLKKGPKNYNRRNFIGNYIRMHKRKNKKYR